jgi:hypothetical protein
LKRKKGLLGLLCSPLVFYIGLQRGREEKITFFFFSKIQLSNSKARSADSRFFEKPLWAL